MKFCWKRVPLPNYSLSTPVYISFKCFRGSDFSTLKERDWIGLDWIAIFSLYHVSILRLQRKRFQWNWFCNFQNRRRECCFLCVCVRARVCTFTLQISIRKSYTTFRILTPTRNIHTRRGGRRLYCVNQYSKSFISFQISTLNATIFIVGQALFNVCGRMSWFVFCLLICLFFLIDIFLISLSTIKNPKNHHHEAFKVKPFNMRN